MVVVQCHMILRSTFTTGNRKGEEGEGRERREWMGREREGKEREGAEGERQ